MSKLPRKTLLFLALALAAGFATAADISIVGGEKVGQAAIDRVALSASVAERTLTITLSNVVGTDVAGGLITSTPVPDGSIVCLKADGLQSDDWRGGIKLGSIRTAPDRCSWGHGVVHDGSVTVAVPLGEVCSAGRTEAAAVISGVVQMPDGKQAWIPHPAAFKILNKGKPATGLVFSCAGGQAVALDANQAKFLANKY
jgi:hypothetical protein